MKRKPLQSVFNENFDLNFDTSNVKLFTLVPNPLRLETTSIFACQLQDKFAHVDTFLDVRIAQLLLTANPLLSEKTKIHSQQDRFLQRETLQVSLPGKRVHHFLLSAHPLYVP